MLFKKLFFLTICCLVFSISSYAQELNLYSFEEVELMQQKIKKPTLLFVTTTWCKYCKQMKQTTFKNKEVIKLLNENYYVIFLEADTAENVTFKNKKYTLKPFGINIAYNEILNVLFQNEKIVFPSLFVFDHNWKVKAVTQTKLNAKQFLQKFFE